MYVLCAWPCQGCDFWSHIERYRAFSSNGRAPASHAGGRGIDTPNVQSFAFNPSKPAAATWTWARWVMGSVIARPPERLFPSFQRDSTRLVAVYKPASRVWRPACRLALFLVAVKRGVCLAACGRGLRLAHGSTNPIDRSIDRFLHFFARVHVVGSTIVEDAPTVRELIHEGVR